MFILLLKSVLLDVILRYKGFYINVDDIRDKVKKLLSDEQSGGHVR